MFSLLIWSLLLLPAALLLRTAWSLATNVRIAKASGIHYVVVPYYYYNRYASILIRPLIRYLDTRFPNSPITSWLRLHLVGRDWPWNLRHKPFAEMGTDTFLAVSPGGIILYTADAEVITQITTRWTDFPKPTHLYNRTMNIYGQNIISSEGAAWRYHRKLTSPSFGEKNNQLVWNETLDQSRGMLESWVGCGSKTINQVADDTMQLSMNVISRAGLSQKLEWSKGGQDGEVTGKVGLSNGHTMTFLNSLHILLGNLAPVILLPKWFLRSNPSSYLRKSCEAYDEWGKYMREIIAAKKTALRSGHELPTIDILGQLVKGLEEDNCGIPQGPAALTDSEVMGNLFVFMLAGHETSANSIHFSLMFLAIHPQVQRKVQKELDDIFQGRPNSEWDYDRDFHRLSGGMLGAVLNEELRIIPPVITIPKTALKPQRLAVDGQEVTVPANIIIRLCVPSVHRNPKFWPHAPPKDQQKPYFPPGNLDNDLEEFKPERWLKNETDEKAENLVNTPGGAAISTESTALYTPPKGAYIPFSGGHRACLGRRFAQVEILAALALILSRYSLELAVDEWAGDEAVEEMSPEEMKDIWMKARDKANFTWQNKMRSVLTLQLRDASVPLRVVKRGEERFWNL